MSAKKHSIAVEMHAKTREVVKTTHWFTPRRHLIGNLHLLPTYFQGSVEKVRDKIKIHIKHKCL